MGKAKLSTPLIFQSKLFCISLLYLFTTLFLALYTSLHPTKCLFRSSPFDPLQLPLFSYPPSYGAHKYAIPTHRSSCSSPVYFSDYWMVLKEIQDFCWNSSVSSYGLKYMNGKSESFGGNFSTPKRVSYFHHLNDSVEIPCGFLKKFRISNSDQIAMESCNGVVVVSAIFNDHDKIRQPKSLGSNTLQSVCFFMFVDDITLKGLDHHQLISRKSLQYTVGVWRIVRVSSKNLYENPAMNGVIPKYLGHRLFPNSKFSIWIDAKLQLMVDPLLLIHALVVSKKVDMAISKHPFFIHTMEEALATARWKKWLDVDGLRIQMETYCENGLLPWTPDKLPYPSDVPDTALILRKHGPINNLFSCLMFNELEAFNPRDQLAFAYVRDRMTPKLKLNMFEVEVFEQVAVEYRHNLKKDKASSQVSETSRTKRIKIVSQDLFVNSSCCSKCQKYLFEMWGESHN
ncbi:probable hexosyltransferase MUCI70 isoform X1 [Ricinus communis]|uniref:probable hexosyltransferase MUCI70 isoform X1 n=1 Tax=Ricinus communis TaxID=3988 RepID=UPI00201A6646|nr:probable hexosyltransferase MUCI70 isoform X1 [Ricinus communis]